MLALVLTAASFTVPERLLVITRYSDEITTRQRAIFERALTTELDKHEGIVVIAPQSDAAPQQCDGSSDCVTRVARALNATGLVEAKVMVDDNTEVVSLRWTALPSGEVRGEATQTVGPAGFFKAGFFKHTAGAASVLGELCQTVFVSHPPRRDVVVGVPEAVSARWEPKPLPRGVFIAGTALTGASAITSLGISLAVLSAEQRYHSYLAAGTDTAPVNGAVLTQLGQHAATLATAANAMWATTVGLAVLTGLTALFTDWGSDHAIEELGPPSVTVLR